MKCRNLAAVLALCLGASAAQADVIDFESLTGSGIVLDDQYLDRGVRFEGSSTGALLARTETFSAVTIPSGIRYMSIQNNFGAMVFVDPLDSTVSATTDFVSFREPGLYAGFYAGYTATALDLDGNVLAAISVPDRNNPLAIQTRTFAVAGIHRIAFSRTSRPALAPLDFFEFNTPVAVPSVVPLPPALWMGLSLLGGVGLIGRLRKRRLA